MEVINKWLFTNPLFYIIIISSLFIIIVYKLFYPRIVGWFGEKYTKDELKKLPKEYKVLNDVLIEVNGTTHQIDHVVVSKHGIFCIETKQYNGFITGSKWDKNWIRHLGKNKYKCINPIRQNYGHVKSLSELLDIDIFNIYNIVCFTGNTKYRINDDGETVNYSNLVDKILSFHNVIIKNTEEIVSTIKIHDIKDNTIRSEHNKKRIN